MKKLRIDFAPPTLARALYLAGPLAWLMLGAALALVGASAWMGWAYLDQQQRFEAELARARAHARVPVAAPVAQLPKISEAQGAAVNAAVAQLNLPWRALHDAVAAATPASIALLALEPDARKRAVKITAEAKNPDEMVSYVEALGKEELFTGATLTRHEINEQDPNRPIRFQVEAQWGAQ
ncbi:MAG: PilN domain-containing protein [Gammaproteobacteria bacterium]